MRQYCDASSKYSINCTAGAENHEYKWYIVSRFDLNISCTNIALVFKHVVMYSNRI